MAPSSLENKKNSSRIFLRTEATKSFAGSLWVSKLHRTVLFVLDVARLHLTLPLVLRLAGSQDVAFHVGCRAARLEHSPRQSAEEASYATFLVSFAIFAVLGGKKA